MSKDIWHFPRLELAQQILRIFSTGLSSALVFFAPRRMGKTEFLRKDILPLAKKEGWCVVYFSFLGVGAKLHSRFIHALKNPNDSHASFLQSLPIINKIHRVGASAIGIHGEVEFNSQQTIQESILEVISTLAKNGKTLLLLDEVQALAQQKINENFIADLRTALDINKDNVKVVFTGSSQDGLRQMFSQAKAPFFHFGQNIPFPNLDRQFTDHLVNVFELVTTRKLDHEIFWQVFLEMQKIPQLARALVERLALNINLTLDECKTLILSEIYDARVFTESWGKCSELEKLILREIANGQDGFFGGEFRKQFASLLGIANLSVSTMQSALRMLRRKELIGQQSERGGYFIEDLHFKSWILQYD